MTDLEPIGPADAVDLYISSRRDDASDATLQSHRSRLRAFIAWCDEEDITNLNDLTGRDLAAYRVWRREGHYATDEDEEPEELERVTLHTQLSTLRRFLRFCASVDAVPEDLYDRVRLPELSRSDDVSDSSLDPSRAPDIIDYLDRYQFASRRHVEVLLLWETGMRMSGLRALDLEDLDLEAERPRASGPAVHLVNRPEKGTRLKNGKESERWCSVSQRVAHVTQAYLDGPRVDARDEFDRRPLLTTEHGRINSGTLRADLYAVTRPCCVGKPCPHDRDPQQCKATRRDHASKCPSSRSPHDVRKGVVTRYARTEVPKPVVSDELNASEDILDKHYDRRSKRERAAQRRRHLPER